MAPPEATVVQGGAFPPKFRPSEEHPFRRTRSAAILPSSHLTTYVRGFLSELPRKSVEPIALEADVPPRTLQQFLSLLDWDHDRLRDRTQHLVARDHPCGHSVGILDDTGCPKKGDKTPGVGRQYCGASGKVDNCVITVHLAYAAGRCTRRTSR